MHSKNFADGNGIKRPRGRPPLALSAGKRKFDTVYAPPSPVVPLPAMQVQTETRMSKENADAAKTMRPQLVVQNVLARLTTEEPLSLSALIQLIPDASKDIIQSCLDILQVLGVVVSVKQKTQSTNIAYTIVNFGRGDVGVKLLEIKQRTIVKLSQADAARKRIQTLEVSNKTFA